MSPIPSTRAGRRGSKQAMRPHAPVEVAVLAFFEEHRRCGALDSGVAGTRVWVQRLHGAPASRCTSL